MEKPTPTAVNAAAMATIVHCIGPRDTLNTPIAVAAAYIFGTSATK